MTTNGGRHVVDVIAAAINVTTVPQDAVALWFLRTADAAEERTWNRQSGDESTVLPLPLIPSPANRFAAGEGRQCDRCFQADAKAILSGDSAVLQYAAWLAGCVATLHGKYDFMRQCGVGEVAVGCAVGLQALDEMVDLALEGMMADVA